MSGKRIRLAGSRWRLLVHEWIGGRSPRYGTSHDVRSHARGSGGDSEYSRTHVISGSEFDELVVGRWIHIEQMDTGTWWMNIGGVTVWVKADRDGDPLSVHVYGPEDYAEPVDGCKYEVTWTEDDAEEVSGS